MIKSTLSVYEWNQTFIVDKLLSSESGQYGVSGDLEGRIQFLYSMYYLEYDSENTANSQADYSGFLVFEGKLGEKEGSFTMSEIGSYGKTGTSNKILIVENSGTGDFENMSGQGSYIMTDSGMDLTLELNE